MLTPLQKMYSATPNHIIITGAGGFIGTALTVHFSQRGYAVTALVRNLPMTALPNVSYFLYDMTKPFDLQVFTPNSVLIHAAYLKNQSIKDGEDLNSWATKNLLKEAKRGGVKQCIFLSSISVLSNENTYYGQQKQAVEKLFNTQEDTILRLGLVVGNGGLCGKSIKVLKRTRLLPLFNKGLQPIYYIGITDLVQNIEQSIKEHRTGTYLLCHAKPMAYQMFYTSIANYLGFKIIALPFPVFLIKFFVFLCAFMQNPPITKDNLAGLLTSNIVRLESEPIFKCNSIDVILTDLK